MKNFTPRIRFGDSEYWFEDEEGENIFGKTFFHAGDFSHGFAVVQDKEGENEYFINTKGENIFGKTFYDTRSFYDGLAKVKDTKLEEFYYTINTKGERVDRNGNRIISEETRQIIKDEIIKIGDGKVENILEIIDRYL